MSEQPTADSTSTDSAADALPRPGHDGSTLEVARRLGIATVNPATGEPLSRQAVKRLVREHRYAATAEQWRTQQREVRRQKRQERRRAARTDPAEPHEKPVAADGTSELDITLVLDCAYDSLMSDKEIRSLAMQMCHCYAVQRAAACPASGGLLLTDYGGRLAEQMLQVNPTHARWQRFGTTSDAYSTALPTDRSVVYLSADADTVLDTLTPGTAYVIGGLVDHNRHKGLTHDRAVALGIPTARLPIDAYVQMSQRRVLTVNHVVAILTYWCEYRDWQQAFLKVIPARKIASTASTATTEDTTEAGEESASSSTV